MTHISPPHTSWLLTPWLRILVPAPPPHAPKNRQLEESRQSKNVLLTHIKRDRRITHLFSAETSPLPRGEKIEEEDPVMNFAGSPSRYVKRRIFPQHPAPRSCPPARAPLGRREWECVCKREEYLSWSTFFCFGKKALDRTGQLHFVRSGKTVLGEQSPLHLTVEKSFEDGRSIGKCTWKVLRHIGGGGIAFLSSTLREGREGVFNIHQSM